MLLWERNFLANNFYTLTNFEVEIEVEIEKFEIDDVCYCYLTENLNFDYQLQFLEFMAALDTLDTAQCNKDDSQSKVVKCQIFKGSRNE